MTESTKSEADKNISAYETQQSFSNLLKGALEKVNDAQVKSDLMTEKLAKGENVDLHNVMIAAQKHLSL